MLYCSFANNNRTIFLWRFIADNVNCFILNKRLHFYGLANSHIGCYKLHSTNTWPVTIPSSFLEKWCQWIVFLKIKVVVERIILKNQWLNCVKNYCFLILNHERELMNHSDSQQKSWSTVRVFERRTRWLKPDPLLVIEIHIHLI